ncbi:efflux RND transporter permease subunit [Paenibacillus kribbensis]|uniref:efflux RND transporter permease subunit n=1 Tax=Paenibacillus kribbensis TaxID=172713 RepID=UPI002DB8525A|nr:efflux RND transporter permease subunit [Paenibacillus kribbensis]MEC0234177.1 efflux RND transporter permease subunit [Paenibacillus kribbensis]
MIEFLVKKSKITLLFFALLIMIGTVNAFQLPKQLMPDIVVKRATVTTIYAGATPELVETTVTRVLESKIKEVANLKTVSSVSASGASVITIETQPTADAPTVWNDLRKKIEDAKADLPDGADDPVINDDLTKAFVQSFAIYGGNTKSLWELQDLMTDWRNQLRSVPGVTDVAITGLPEEQVRIEADASKLQQYGIPWEAIMNAVQTENDRVPTGTLDYEKRNYQLKVPVNHDATNLGSVVVFRSSNGTPVYVKDVATVTMANEKVEYLSYYNGQPSLSIQINSEVGSDVQQMYERVNAKMNELKSTLPAKLKIDSLFAQKDETDHIFSNLMVETITAIAVVVIVCMLGLNLLTSSFVALAIPISIAIAMTFLPGMDITLNQITVIGLIIVLGILVDDAVVVNDNIERRLSVLRETPYDAAIKGTKEVSISILTATTATITAFMPLLFLTGDVGAFIKPIPVVISLAMIASMAMSLTIIPIFRIWYEKRKILKGKKSASEKPAGLLGKQIQKASDAYAYSLMPKVLKRPMLIALSGLIASSVIYGLTAFTPVQLFPRSSDPELTIKVTMPTGASFEDTDQTIKQMTAWVQQQPGVESVSSAAGGTASPLFYNITNIPSYSINSGEILVKGNTEELDSTSAVSEWPELLKQKFPQVTTSVTQTELGIPVGKPVSIRILGTDLEKIRTLTDQVKNVVAETGGTSNISDSMGVQDYTLDFEVNRAALDRYNVTYESLTRTLLMMGTGVSIGDFDNGRDLVDIKIFMKDASSVDPAILFQQVNVTSKNNVQVPLAQLVDIHPTFSIKQINHYNLSRSNTIEADVTGRTATEVMQDIEAGLAKIQFPPGYSWEVGGEKSKQTDIFADLAKLFAVVIVLIFILIAMQFYSMWIPLIVMTTVYLAAAGGVLGLFISQTPIGFMSIMGVISLAGIVVRNGIVLIEFIEDARHEGMTMQEAIIQAASARFRPILLTSMAAIVALLPMATVGEELFRPLAIAIVFGLVFSTILTLFVVPSLYMVMARQNDKRKTRKLEQEALLEAKMSHYLDHNQI